MLVAMLRLLGHVQRILSQSSARSIRLYRVFLPRALRKLIHKANLVHGYFSGSNFSPPASKNLCPSSGNTVVLDSISIDESVISPSTGMKKRSVSEHLIRGTRMKWFESFLFHESVPFWCRSSATIWMPRTGGSLQFNRTSSIAIVLKTLRLIENRS